MHTSVFQTIVILIAIPIAAFEIWMFVDLIKNKHLTKNAKILWLIGMLLLHPFVAIFYYFKARTKLG